jgi:hypothetical protein
LIKILTLGNYEKFIQHLDEKSGTKKEEGKIVSSITTGLKKRVDIESIHYWVSNTNFELNKLKNPQQLVDLFNSYYPINCPYQEKLNEFERLQVIASPNISTNNRYKTQLSWDLLLDISFDDFNSDYLSKSKFDTPTVYSSLVGESFIRRLSTNIIDGNGQIVFKSTDGDGDFYEYNKNESVFDKSNFTKRHFNQFIRKLNEMGGVNKFDANIGYEDENTNTSQQNKLIGTLLYDEVIKNNFIVNVIKYLAVSMVPLIVNITRIIIAKRINYYGLFYHYYEASHDGDCYFLYNNINEKNNTFITSDERNAINEFINTHIPNDYYNKCIVNTRIDNPMIEFPDCRVIDFQQNALYTFSHTLITLPFHPFPTIGRYIQILKFDNISNEDITKVDVKLYGLILWNADLNKPFAADVYDDELSSFVSKEVPLSYVTEENVGSTFYKGFLEPILSSLKQVTPVNSQNTTPRNTVTQF